MRVDQSGVFIVDEAEYEVGGSAWWSGEILVSGLTTARACRLAAE